MEVCQRKPRMKKHKPLQFKVVTFIIIKHLACLFVAVSRHEMFAIMVHKNFNLKRRLVTFFWGETMDFERFSTLHSAELVEAVFSMSSHIQKLELCKTEMIILSCIPLFFTGKYPGIYPSP